MFLFILYPFTNHLPMDRYVCQGKKAGLIECLEKYAASRHDARPEMRVNIIDGACKHISTNRWQPFGDYSVKVFAIYINREQYRVQ